MVDQPEKIGVDVWLAGTIYVDAATVAEADAIVAERYAGTREKPDTYEHMNGEDLPMDGDDFMSSAVTFYGLCSESELLAATDPVRDAAPAMLEALRTILEGSGVTGRWLDPNGKECSEADDGATWEAYTGEEQDQWLLTVAVIARSAIARAEGVANG